MSGRKQFDIDAALDQAMRVFWQRGYADASLDALGSATGLGRGSLYGAFGNKDALFGKCLDRYASIYGAQYEQALAAHPGDPVRGCGVLRRHPGPHRRPVGPRGRADRPVRRAVTDAEEEEDSVQVRGLLDLQRQRVHTALAASSADSRTLDELATFVVAVNQSLAVLSRAGASDARAALRDPARLHNGGGHLGPRNIR